MAHLRLFLLHQPKLALFGAMAASRAPAGPTHRPSAFQHAGDRPTFGPEEEQMPDGRTDRCPEGCASHDTPSHGFWECPLAKEVWKESAEVLARFCPELAADVVLQHLTIQDVVLGFPTIWTARRHRLLVWHAATISFLSHFGERGIANARRSSAPLRWRHRQHNPQAWITGKIQDSIRLAWKQVESQHDEDQVAVFRSLWLDTAFGEIRYTFTAVPYLYFPRQTQHSPPASTSTAASSSAAPTTPAAASTSAAASVSAAPSTSAAASSSGPAPTTAATESRLLAVESEGMEQWLDEIVDDAAVVIDDSSDTGDAVERSQEDEDFKVQRVVRSSKGKERAFDADQAGLSGSAATGSNKRKRPAEMHTQTTLGAEAGPSMQRPPLDPTLGLRASNEVARSKPAARKSANQRALEKAAEAEDQTTLGLFFRPARR